MGAYVGKIRRLMWHSCRVLRADGFLVLVIEPVAGFNVMAPLSAVIKRHSRFTLLGSYHWSHASSRSEGVGSWVVFLGKKGARLNRGHPAWDSLEWFIPRPSADLNYGFWEWPVGLVGAIVGLTIPEGGRVLDPYAGKAVALSQLSPRFEVTAVDVLNIETTISSAGAAESGGNAMANQVLRARRGQSVIEESPGGG